MHEGPPDLATASVHQRCHLRQWPLIAAGCARCEVHRSRSTGVSGSCGLEWVHHVRQRGQPRMAQARCAL